MWPLGWYHWSALGATGDGANTGSGRFWGSDRSWEQGHRCCCPSWLPLLEGFSTPFVPRSVHAQVSQHHWGTGCFPTKDIETVLNFNWHSSVVQFNNSTWPWQLRLLGVNRLKCSGVRRTNSRPEGAVLVSQLYPFTEQNISDCHGGSLTLTELCQGLHFRL